MSDDGIEEAARAFDADIRKSNGAAPAPASKAPRESAEGPPERMFGNVGDLEVDEDSPVKGGGDDDPEEVIYKEQSKKGKRDPEGSEDGDDDEPDADGAEEDEDGEEEDEGGEDEFLAQAVQVIVDGEEKEVTVKEALEGYVRTETFHKRLSELGEAKKIIQRAAADAVQNYEYSTNLAKEIQSHLDALIPQEPNWDEEFKKNPTKAREMQKYYEQVKGFRGALKEKMNEAAKKQAESDSTQLATFAAAERQRFESINSKHWSTDPKKKGKDLQAMRRTAIQEGFSEEEVAQVYDSRMLNVLLKASKYDRMMAARPKPVQKGRSKPVAPGTGSAKTRTAHRGASSAMKRLNKTGSIEDAAVVFDEIIRRG
jgi:hypothetical protein